MDDFEILSGLTGDFRQREKFEQALYFKFSYLINTGTKDHGLTYDESFSAYSDAVLSAIRSFRTGKFEHKSSIKTYINSIFSNKCIDEIRKKMSGKGKVNYSVAPPELMAEMPDKVKSVIDNLIKEQRVQALREGLDTIGENCKKILLLYTDDYSDREIAEMTQYENAAVVKVTRLRCLAKLQEKMRGFIVNE